MTSASSSSPKKGLSFFSYHRNLFGRRLWVGVVSIVLQLLFYTVATPLRIVYDRSQVADQLTTEIARATYRTKQAQMIFGQMCLSSIAMGLTLLLAVVIAHQGFAYVFSRRELDFYMSQPVKRSRHFRDVYINGIMLFALPYMISVLLGVCVAEGMHSMSTLVFGEILYGMLRMFFFFVAVYSIAVIAVLTTGREIYAILVTIFLLLFEFVAHAVLALLRSYYLVTYYPTGSGITSMGRMFITPAYNFMMGKSRMLSAIDHYGNVDSTYQLISQDFSSLCYLAFLSLLGSIIAYFCFKKRRSEDAGCGICFRHFELFVKGFCAIFGAVFFGTLMDQIFSNLEWRGRTLILFLIILISSLLISSFIEVMLRRDIKRFFKGYICTIVSCIAAILLVVIYRWDLMGYDTYVPKTSEVIDYSFRPTNPTEVRHIAIYDTTEEELEAVTSGMHLTEVKPMAEIARISQENMVSAIKDYPKGFSLSRLLHGWQEEDDRMNQYGWDAVVTWRLKNGRSVTRQMRVPTDIDSSLMDRIIANDNYRNPWYRLSELPYMASQSNISLRYDGGYTDHSINDANTCLQEFMKVYSADLTQYGFTFASNNRGIGQVEWWADDNDMNFEVYPSYTNTIAFLRRYNLFVEPVPDLANISNLVIERTVYTDSDASTDRIEITDEKELEELQSLMTSMEVYGDWSKDQTQNYYITQDKDSVAYDIMFNLNDQGTGYGQQVWMVFRDGEVPDWVEEKF